MYQDALIDGERRLGPTGGGLRVQQGGEHPFPGGDMTHDEVTLEERAVVARLLADWQQPFRLTSVSQAVPREELRG